MISIVIPAFNEADELPATLAAIRAQQTPHEIVVVDAASVDGTVALARSAGVKVISSERRQRATQLNLGAAAAQSDVLLFLHADTRLPNGALAKVEAVLRRPDVIGGGFARRFVSHSLFLQMTCALAEVRTRVCGWFLGDQAMFVRRSRFEMLGGFREWDRFEDLDFSRRMARTGKVVTLRPPVFSAARRFVARGPLRTTWNDLRLTMRYLAGGMPKPGGPLPTSARTLVTHPP